MLNTSKRLLPYEPGFTGHWDVEKRRKETKAWLRQREREVAARVSRERETSPPRSSPTMPRAAREAAVSAAVITNCYKMADRIVPRTRGRSAWVVRHADHCVRSGGSP